MVTLYEIPHRVTPTLMTPLNNMANVAEGVLTRADEFKLSLLKQYAVR